MKFTVTHAPDSMGHQIALTVDGESAAISRVQVALDGVSIDDDSLDPPSVQYNRQFRHVGSLTPGDDHTLVVTATDSSGKDFSSTTVWTDP